MTLGRVAAFALALGVLGTSAYAGNGSNYIHLTNGVDYFFNYGQGIAGQLSDVPVGNLPYGQYRCFDNDMLHAPTKVVNPTDPNVGTYATKLCGVEINFAAAPTTVINFPLVVLSSNAGTCTFLTSAGALNYDLASGFGNGFFGVVGPTNAPTTPTVLAAITNLTFAPTGLPNGTVLTLSLLFDALSGGAVSTVTVPDGDDLVVFVHGNSNATAANPQGFSWSADERNICSSHSYMINTNAGTGVVTFFAFATTVEWSFGTSSLDAVTTTTITSLGGGPSNLNAQAAFGIDGGSGTRTISITGTDPSQAGGSLGSEVLGFLTWDENHPFGGSGRYVFINVVGFEQCFNTTLTLPTGGPGGPVLTNAIPQMPRTIKLDALTIALANNPIWFALTGHDTLPGGVNQAYLPNPAAISGATGVTGGVLIPIPPFPTLPGIKLMCQSVPLNAPIAGASFIDSGVNNGHSNSLSYGFQFHP